MYYDWVKQRPELDFRRRATMLDDFDEVNTLDDHTGMFGVWRARPLWKFMRHPTMTLPLDSAQKSFDIEGINAETALRILVDRLRTAGMDPIVVDQSNDTIREELGLHAVKVVVPGTVPMTFGHRNRRLENLPRLASAEQVLAYSEATIRHAASAPPHPFP
jgi:ribosomal protein S12 methylthiotransferase accessory factor